jgi:hypothetical protein
MARWRPSLLSAQFFITLFIYCSTLPVYIMGRHSLATYSPLIYSLSIAKQVPTSYQFD